MKHEQSIRFLFLNKTSLIQIFVSMGINPDMFKFSTPKTLYKIHLKYISIYQRVLV